MDYKVHGEVVTCPCFFEFWFWYINCENIRDRYFSQIIGSVTTEIITDFLGKAATDEITIKVLDDYGCDDFTADFWSSKTVDVVPVPCIVFSYCKKCYEKMILLIASSNKLTFEQARQRCCSDAHGLQFLYNSF